MISKQNDVNMIFRYKEYLGKAFFIIAILVLFFMITSKLTNVFFFPDDFFTFGMIKYSFSDILTATAVDTHPPGHYFILKLFISLLDTLHISYDSIFATKLVSMLPYALILLVSLTKLRKEYGWLTSGVFVFAIGVMSGFFFQFLSIRMYNWGLFFLLMSFIYFKDIINDSDIKSWVLFSLFSALVLYTQYFFAFSTALIYLSLFVYLFCFCQDNFKEEFKKFIGSIILVILIYSPWIPYFIKQMSKKRGSHNLAPVDVSSIINTCIYYLTGNDFLMIKILAIIFTIFLIILAFKKYNLEPTPENYYIVSGFFIFFGTIFIAILVSITKEPIILSRYFIPVASIIWLSISILITKIDKNKLFIVSIIFLLIFGCLGISEIYYDGNEKYDIGTGWQDMFEEMNNDPNAIVIYNGEVGVFEYETFLDNIKSYSPPLPAVWGVNTSTAHELYDFEEKSPEQLLTMINNNTDNKVYFIDAWGPFKVNNNNLTNAKLNEIGHMASAKFYEVGRNG